MNRKQPEDYGLSEDEVMYLEYSNKISTDFEIFSNWLINQLANSAVCIFQDYIFDIYEQQINKPRAFMYQPYNTSGYYLLGITYPINPSLEINKETISRISYYFSFHVQQLDETEISIKGYISKDSEPQEEFNAICTEIDNQYKNKIVSLMDNLDSPKVISEESSSSTGNNQIQKLFIPKKSKTIEKYKYIYSLYKQMVDDYVEDFKDDRTDKPNFSYDDFRVYLLDHNSGILNKIPGTRQLRNIISVAENQLI